MVKQAPIIALAFLAASAAGEEAFAQGTTQLQEIVVSGEGSGKGDPQSPTGPGVGFTATRTTTATKTDTPILETPQSISVVTRQQIRDTGAQTVGQAISYNAGIQTAPFGYDARYDQFIVRGFTTDTVGLYRDGLRQGNAPFGRFRNDPWDLDRIEILRGPPSVLYGSSNPGGLVNLVSRTPVEGKFGTAAADFGSFNIKQTRIDLNTPVTTGGNIFFRVDGFFRDANTQVPDTPNNRINVSPSLLFNLDNQTTLVLLGNYAGNRNSMWPYYVHNNLNYVYNIRAGDPAYDALRQNQYYFGYKFEHRYNENLIFRQNFRTGHVGFDGGFVDQIPFPPGQTIINRYAGRFVDQLYTTNVDTNAQAKFKTGPIAHTVLGGVDYFGQKYSEFVQGTDPKVSAAPPIDLLNPGLGTGFSPGPVTLNPTAAINTRQSIDQVGVYGQEQMALGGLRITLGGRADHAKTSTDNLFSLSNATPTNKQSEAERFTYRAGALYLFDFGAAPYVSYSTSFLPIPGTTVDGSPFKPTTGRQIEGGVKYAPPRLNTTFTATYFRILQDNVVTSDPNNAGFSIQTGQVRSQGFEFEAITNIAPGLNGLASYSNIDAIVTKSSNIAFDLGKVPIAVPRNQGAVFLDYTLQSGRFIGLGGGAGFRYIGQTFADLGNFSRNGAIPAVDLQAHYDTGKVRFQVIARNVADRRVPICNGLNCTFSEARLLLGSMAVRW